MSNTPDKQGEALEPCPFCPAQLTPFPKDHLPDDLQSDAAKWFQITHNAGCYFVLLGFGDYPIHQDRLKAWNTRSRASVAAVEGDDEPDNLRLAPLGHALSSITSPMAQTPEVVAVWNEFWKLNSQLNKRDAAASAPAPAEKDDDGWVTFGRVKVDIENETETFERIYPPKPTCGPARPNDGSECAYSVCPRPRDGCSEYCWQHHKTQCAPAVQPTGEQESKR